jgi:predicted secreted protein
LRADGLTTDLARLEVLGFSADGRHFGYAQFGKLSENAYPYADAFFVETGRDQPLADTPVRLVLEDRVARPEAAMMRLEAKLGPLLRDLGLGWRGRVLWRNRAQDMRAVERRAVVELPRLGASTIRLVPVDTPPNAACTAGGPPGQNIKVDVLDSNNVPVRLLADERGGFLDTECPIAFGIADVRVLDLPENRTALAVVIEYFRTGPNGPERRYRAVTSILE